MREFTYNANSARVVFGAGTISRLPDEVARLGLNRVLVLATPQQAESADELAQLIGSRACGVFSGARMHTPVDVTAQALEMVASCRADGLVAVGGGSTTGLAKAIALRTDLPQIVAPTTYAGSEMTPILGETSNGQKVTRTDPRVLPEVVIYDVSLTLSLPAGPSVTSGFNAIAHAVEALYARDANPIVSQMAETAIAALAQSLPVISREPRNGEARTEALFGAWLCGICLGSVGMALHHKLAHTLGGSYDLDHAGTHTALLPHSLAYNAAHVPRAIETISRALEVSDPSAGLYDLARACGATMALKDLGLPEEAIMQVPELVLEKPYWNPRPLEIEPLRSTVQAAYNGCRPTVG